MRTLIATLTLGLLSVPTPPAAALKPHDAEALQDTLTELIATHPTAKRTNIALKVTDLETGEVLFDKNSDKLFTPASNLKIYTSAAALALLGPEHRWTTRMSAYTEGAEKVDNGVINGSLVIVGGCDPMFGFSDLDAMAEALIQKHGIETIRRDVLVIGPGFGMSDWINPPSPKDWTQLPLKGPGWMWDDEPDYYNMTVMPLMMDFNVLQVTANPTGDSANPVAVRFEPKSKYPPTQVWQHQLNTEFEITRRPFEDQIDVYGVPEEDDKSERITMHRPDLWIASVLTEMLLSKGVEIGEDEERKHLAPPTASAWLIEYQGKTNAEAVKHFLKVSENAVGEMLLLTLSEKFGEGDKVSWPSGAKVISDWLVKTAGLEEGSFRLVDGSGLSRYNLISADSSIRLLAYMKTHEHFEPFFDGLPVYEVKLPGAEDGAKWAEIPLAEFDAERVFAKPGGMSGVSTISGYIQTLDGRWLAFSLLGNGYVGSSAPVRDLRDRVWAELVRYQPAEAAVPAE